MSSPPLLNDIKEPAFEAVEALAAEVQGVGVGDRYNALQALAADDPVLAKTLEPYLPCLAQLLR